MDKLLDQIGLISLFLVLVFILGIRFFMFLAMEKRIKKDGKDSEGS